MGKGVLVGIGLDIREPSITYLHGKKIILQNVKLTRDLFQPTSKEIKVRVRETLIKHRNPIKATVIIQIKLLIDLDLRLNISRLQGAGKLIINFIPGILQRNFI